MPCTGTLCSWKITAIKVFDPGRKLIPEEKEVDNKLKKAPISPETEQLSFIYVKSRVPGVS